jgi:1-acyl-sn-glycerol-3-phosphate acyltransferase
MVARTGVARLALLSGAPVLPVAQWGVQEVLTASGAPARSPAAPCASGSVRRRPGGLRDQPLSADVLREAHRPGDGRVHAELEVLRGEQAPRSATSTPREAAADGDGRRTA